MATMSMKKPKAPEAPPLTKELYQAIKDDKLDKVKLLLKKEKVNPNVIDPTPENTLKESPLLIACSNQNVEIARLLVKNKLYPADVNCENVQGKRPIW